MERRAPQKAVELSGAQGGGDLVGAGLVQPRHVPLPVLGFCLGGRLVLFSHR
jgi:hypothetical protein